nr:putative metalloprotease Tcis_Metallo_9 [Tityus cisandinus]
MIFCLTNFVFFATVSAIPSGRNEIVFPSVETSRSEVKTIKFTAFDQDVELKLISAGEILGKGFAMEGVDVENLRRKIYRDSANGAALLLDEDGPITIEGIVNSKLRIKPYDSEIIIKDGVIAHQIVELINDKISYFKDAVMTEEIKKETKNVARMARDGECIVVEYLLVTESNFTQRFENTEAMSKYVTVMFTGVQNLIDTLEMGIKVRLIGGTSFTKETEPSFIEESSIPGHNEILDPDNLMTNMQNYFCNFINDEVVQKADLIMLILNRRMGKIQEAGTLPLNVAGVSNSGSVCRPCIKIGACVDNSNYNERIDTVAHESVHILGSPHDGEGPEYLPFPFSPGSANCSASDGYIMGTRNDQNGKKFSECTKKCVKYLLSLPSAFCVYENCK